MNQYNWKFYEVDLEQSESFWFNYPVKGIVEGTNYSLTKLGYMVDPELTMINTGCSYRIYNNEDEYRIYANQLFMKFLDINDFKKTLKIGSSFFIIKQKLSNGKINIGHTVNYINRDKIPIDTMLVKYSYYYQNLMDKFLKLKAFY